MVCMFFNFQALCDNSWSRSFHCESDDLLWRIEREKDKSAFAFFYKERLIAYRHLESIHDHFLTNHYDLELKLFPIGQKWKGHLKGRLMGKVVNLERLFCSEGVAP